MNIETGTRHPPTRYRQIWLAFCLLLILVVLFPASVRAGWVIPLELRDFRDKNPHVYPLQVLVGKDSLKVDITVLVGGPGKTDLLYRGSGEEIVYIVHDQRVYIVTDERSFSGISQGIGQLTRFLDQRMGTALSESGVDGYRVLVLDGVRRIGDKVCTGRAVFQGEQKIMEIWGIPWKQSGVRPADLAPLQRFLSAVGRMRSGFGHLLSLGGWAEPPVEYILSSESYPVLAQQVAGSTVRMEAAWGKPKPRNPGTDDFHIPAQYVKKELIPFLIESGYIR